MTSPQFITLMVTFVVGFATIVYYMVSVQGKRISNLDKRIDDMNTSINTRLDDMNTVINARFGDMNANINARFDDMSRQLDCALKM